MGEVPPGFIKPEGSLEITENGTFDVKEKAEVNVDVPSTPWERPKEWLPYPEMSVERDEIWMLIHVTRDYGASCLWEKGAYIIDWGDGVVEEKSGFSKMHYYNFEDLDEKSETELGYRQCWCRAYRERNTLSEFYFGRNYFHSDPPDKPGSITVVEFIINVGGEEVI